MKSANAIPMATKTEIKTPIKTALPNETTPLFTLSRQCFMPKKTKDNKINIVPQRYNWVKIKIERKTATVQDYIKNDMQDDMKDDSKEEESDRDTAESINTLNLASSLPQ